MSPVKIGILIFLCAVVLLTMIAVLGANIGVFGTDVIVADFAKWGRMAVVGEILGLLVFVVKYIFRQPRFWLVIGAPKDLTSFDISQISWDTRRCFVKRYRGDKVIQEIVIPTLSRFGPSFEVRLPEGILEKLSEHDTLELELLDDRGLRWYVAPFFPFQLPLNLSLQDDRTRILESYGDQG